VEGLDEALERVDVGGRGRGGVALGGGGEEVGGGRHGVEAGLAGVVAEGVGVEIFARLAGGRRVRGGRVGATGGRVGVGVGARLRGRTGGEAEREGEEGQAAHPNRQGRALAVIMKRKIICKVIG